MGSLDVQTLAREQRPDTRDAQEGIIENLLAVARQATSKATLRRKMMLASPPVTHFCQRASDVLGHWSCGYRNCQMLCSALLSRPDFRPLLFRGASFVPQVNRVTHTPTSTSQRCTCGPSLRAGQRVRAACPQGVAWLAIVPVIMLSTCCYVS
jgi:hypothetical protein